MLNKDISHSIVPCSRESPNPKVRVDVSSKLIQLHLALFGEAKDAWTNDMLLVNNMFN